MRYVLAIILGLHGIAHLVGFVVSWQLMSSAEMPYKTTILAGQIDLGDTGIRIAGLLWLAAAAACLVAASAIWLHMPWAATFTLTTLTASLLLCVAGWPDARIGAFLNAGLLLALLVLPRLGVSIAASTP